MKPLLSAVLLLGFSALAYSNPILLRFSGLATGTLGVTSFTDAPFTVTSSGDTGSVFVTFDSVAYLPAIDATIDIGGFSPAAFLDPNSWVDPQGSGDIEFADNGIILAFTHLFAGLENYQFQNTITVVGGFPFIPNLFENFQNIPTNEGLLTIEMTSDNAFNAVVFTPEPALGWFALAALSVVILGTMRRTRRG
jgi:hypothetical protein